MRRTYHWESTLSMMNPIMVKMLIGMPNSTNAPRAPISEKGSDIMILLGPNEGFDKLRKLDA